MIRKVYEVDPLTCSQCGGTMKVIAFITDFSVVSIHHSPRRLEGKTGTITHVLPSQENTKYFL